MCGITGAFTKNNNIDPSVAEAMVKSLRHRGPDDEGAFTDGNIFLGHTRLSIQDISRNACQPMKSYDDSVVLVFNGEIYNFKELRSQLSEFSFRSQSDTEVLLYAYQKWGLEEALKRVNGMFAFAIYDKNNSKIYLARDRIGIKPLVYYWDNSTFMFASELKSLRASGLMNQELNPEAVMDYFVYRYVAHPKSIYKYASKLSPGHYLSFDIANNSYENYCYWTPQPNPESGRGSKTEKVEQLLRNSVQSRLIADVPVGTFTSGGIDSALITRFASEKSNQLNAFTINFASRSDEAKRAQEVAQQCQTPLHAHEISQKDFDAVFDDIIAAYDEPIADSSIIPTYFLCQTASSSGYKSVLSGDGADELFFGYKWHRIFSILEKYQALGYIPGFSQIAGLFSKTKAFSYLKYPSLERYRRIMFDRYTRGEVANLFNFDVPNKKNNYLYRDVLGKSQVNSSELSYLDLKTFLVDDILYKMDMASMAHGLEVRTPFLDHQLVEMAMSIPADVHQQNGETKTLLKRLTQKYFTEEIAAQPKQGFSAPIQTWLPDRNQIKHALKNGRLVSDNVVSEKSLNRFLEKKSNWSFLWQLYMFERWYAYHVAR